MSMQGVSASSQIITLERLLEEMTEDRDQHRDAVMAWEKAMMEAVGEDGVGSVTEAIAKIKQQRDELMAAMESIRKISTSRYAVDTANEAITKIQEQNQVSITEKLEAIRAEVVKTSYAIEKCGASPELTDAVIQNGRVIDMVQAAMAEIQEHRQQRYMLLATMAKIADKNTLSSVAGLQRIARDTIEACQEVKP